MVSPCCRSACSAGSCSGSLFAPGSLGESRWTSKTRFELTHHANNSEKTGQGGIHDQLRRGALQAASANAALVRARGAAEAVALARKYASLYGCGFGTAGGDPDAGARHGREPGRHRNHFEYAREDDRDGKADGRVRTSGPAGVVARGGKLPARAGAAACDCESDSEGGEVGKSWTVFSPS